ncbi:hypothetical protein [Brazilian marseillevirus]|uniref:hypothetical protein n=1 Tax=Brazilian marseillevirus TaxID=1813599 RepID=UPI000784CD05|nr:hypothetical protein A3303_gp175 [Brazilian marseillevirus]AMQ10683.1 hypothetical protein [Brazilian marseillevirus]
MNKFMENNEFVAFSIACGAPNLSEQKERYLKEREFDIRTDIIGSELFWFVLPELTELEKHYFLLEACEKEDVKAFIALGGDNHYIEQNDYVNFDLSIEFYCDLFQMGKLDLDYFVDKLEGKDKQDAMALAYLFSSMLREVQRRNTQ